MSNEITNQHLMEISKTIEKSFNELNLLVNRISEIDDVIKTIEKNSEYVREKYSNIFDNSNFKQTKEEYKNSVKDLEKSLEDIEQKIINIQTIKRVTGDNLENILKKMGRFEKLLNDLNSRTKSLDKKLSQGMETLNYRQNNVIKKSEKSLKFIELNHDLDKYDEIIKLQKENNLLLKKLTNSND